MPYVANKPGLPPDYTELEQRIPGWGADLDPAQRPAVPKERFAPNETGAHWVLPDRQPEKGVREKSREHAMVTPVFGTSCPTRGLSGLIRRLAYARWSEGQTAHWLALVVADRVDVLESLILDALRGHPDNFIAEYGLGAERKYRGLRSRFGRNREDTKHLPVDLLFFGGTWVAIAAIAAVVLPRRRRSARTLGRTAMRWSRPARLLLLAWFLARRP